MSDQESPDSLVSARGALSSVGLAWPTHHVPLQYGATPDVTDLRRTAIVLDDGELYLERYHLVDTHDVQIRIHHWHTGDDDRALHDHPWPNCTTVLAGRLREHTPDGVTELRVGDVVTRAARHPHRIELITDDAWTLFVTGRIERKWGFHTAAGWVHWQDWPHAGRYEEGPVL